MVADAFGYPARKPFDGFNALKNDNFFFLIMGPMHFKRNELTSTVPVPDVRVNGCSVIWLQTPLEHEYD